MDARDQLTDAFERGFESAGEALSPDIRDLYWIQHFLICYEMGGWLYNWSTPLEHFDVTIPALKRRGLADLAEILSRVRQILAPVGRIVEEAKADGAQITWYEILELIDPENELESLESDIDALPDYGLPERW
ncbi:MAG: hypothetical protein QM773_02850 [Hyphomonadaceae bacterium]